MKSRIAILGIVSGLLLAGGVAPRVSAQQAVTSEYQVEAAFLYHFAKFVSWPAEAFPATNAPITIGVLGESPFGAELEECTRNKTLDGRAFKILHLDMGALAEATQCQIVFICPSEKKRLKEILAALKGKSVLTVSKTERFTEAGGMINFILEDKKVRFEINDEAAKQAGLKISAKLLNLARNKQAG